MWGRRVLVTVVVALIPNGVRTRSLRESDAADAGGPNSTSTSDPSYSEWLSYNLDKRRKLPNADGDRMIESEYWGKEDGLGHYRPSREDTISSFRYHQLSAIQAKKNSNGGINTLPPQSWGEFSAPKRAMTSWLDKGKVTHPINWHTTCTPVIWDIEPTGCIHDKPPNVHPTKFWRPTAVPTDDEGADHDEYYRVCTNNKIMTEYCKSDAEIIWKDGEKIIPKESQECIDNVHTQKKQRGIDMQRCPPWVPDDKLLKVNPGDIVTFRWKDTDAILEVEDEEAWTNCDYTKVVKNFAKTNYHTEITESRTTGKLKAEPVDYGQIKGHGHHQCPPKGGCVWGRNSPTVMFIPDYESAQPDLFKWMMEDMQERYPENKDAQYMIQAAGGDVPNKPGFGVNWDKPVYYLISERYCKGEDDDGNEINNGGLKMKIVVNSAATAAWSTIALVLVGVVSLNLAW